MFSTVPLRQVDKNPPKRTSSELKGAFLVKIYPAVVSGSLISLERDESIFGRDAICDYEVADEFASRQHLSFHWSKNDCFLTDLGSTNGTFVNDREVSHQKLKHGDKIQFGTQIFKFLSSEDVEATYHEAVFQMMTIDALTQTYNRRYFEDVFQREARRCHRHHRSLGLLILDIDHFKKINDTYGHLVGDEVLKGLCARLSRRIRHDEVFARVGGEEFAIALVEGTHETLDQVGQDLCELVAQAPFETSKGKIPVTISVGGGFATGGTLLDSQRLYELADSNLYRAKETGRNRYVGR